MLIDQKTINLAMLAAHPDTPEEEARTAAMLLAKRIAKQASEKLVTGKADAWRETERKQRQRVVVDMAAQEILTKRAQERARAKAQAQAKRSGGFVSREELTERMRRIEENMTPEEALDDLEELMRKINRD